MKREYWSEYPRPYDAEEIARALHDFQNYPFPMPSGATFDDLKKKSRKKYMDHARALLDIMDSYRDRTNP